MSRTTQKNKVKKSPAKKVKATSTSKVAKSSKAKKTVKVASKKTKTTGAKKAAKKAIVIKTKVVKKTAAKSAKKIKPATPAIKIQTVVTPPAPVNSTIAVSKNIYLSNKELLAEVKRAKKLDIMTNQLARMLQLLCGKYAKKGSFVGYTYNEDMQAYAMLMLVRTWKSFDPEKSDNPFAFFTQCIKNSFIQYLNQEKRQRNVRDLLLVDQGMNPSFGFVDEHNEKHYVDDEEDFQAMQDAFKKSKSLALDDDGETGGSEEPSSPVINIDPATISVQEQEDYSSY